MHGMNDWLVLQLFCDFLGFTWYANPLWTILYFIDLLCPEMHHPSWIAVGWLANFWKQSWFYSFYKAISFWSEMLVHNSIAGIHNKLLTQNFGFYVGRNNCEWWYARRKMRIKGRLQRRWRQRRAILLMSLI